MSRKSSRCVQNSSGKNRTFVTPSRTDNGSAGIGQCARLRKKCCASVDVPRRPSVTNQYSERFSRQLSLTARYISGSTEVIICRRDQVPWSLFAFHCSTSCLVG